MSAAQGAKAASKSSPIAELSILPLAGGDFAIWMERLMTYLTRTYGQHGRQLILAGTKMVPTRPAPEVITPITEDMTDAVKQWTNSTNELNRELNKASASKYTRLVQKIDEDLIAIYAVIWGQLSDASQAKIRSTTADFITIESDSKAVELWAAVKKVHQTSNTGCAELDKEEARNKFYTLKCQSNETLVAFRNRFDACINAMVALELDKPSEQDQATRFLAALDNERFGSFKVELHNNAQLGASQLPKNLADMVHMATNYKVVVSGAAAQGGAGAVFTAHAASVRPNNPHAKSDNNGNGPSQPKQGKKKANNGGKPAADKSDKKREPKCKLCEGPHWVDECDNFKAMKAQFNLSKSAPSTGRAHVAMAEVPDSFVFPVRTCESCAFTVSGGSHDRNVLLDNQASVSVFHSRSLVRDIRDARPDEEVKVKGINGDAGLMLTKIGTTEWFGEVFYCPQASANVLSLGKVEEIPGVTVTYAQGERFTVNHDGGPTFVFNKTVIDPRNGGSLFMCKFEPWRAHMLVTTVADNEAKYPKADVLRAKGGREFIELLGYPSMGTASKIVLQGAITDLPVTVADLQLAVDIYGPDPAMVRGKTTQSKSQPVRTETIPRLVETKQSLHADLMYVDSEPYLVSVSKPMQLIVATHLGGSRNKAGLRKAISDQLGLYKAHGFEVQMLFSDCEGGLATLISELNNSGVLVNLASPGQHVPAIERAIRTIKERIRCHLVSLPFKLPRVFMKWLVYYVVGRINMVPSGTSGDFISPREKILGRKTNFKRDVRIGFMQSVLLPVTSDEQSNSVREPRAFTALSLVPTGNLQGSVTFYNLATGKTVTRERWTETPMTVEVIAQLQAMEPSPSVVNGGDPVVTIGQRQLPVQSLPSDEEDEALPSAAENAHEESSPLDYSPGDEGAVVKDNKVVIQGLTEDTLEPDFEYWPPDPERGASIAEEQRAKKVAILPAGAEIAEVYTISIPKAIQDYGIYAFEALFREVHQLLRKDVFEPVHIESLTREQRLQIIRSKLFLALKFLANGDFQQIKGRLVAGGDMQDRSMYEESDTSSPTCSLGALMMVAGIAAKEHRHVYAIDIGGAYLNADMTADVHMRLDPKVAEIACAIDPKYREYMEERGSIIVKLKKALYGCIESGKLWYDKLVSILLEIGFSPNPHERCVFNIWKDGNQLTIAVYVDDLLLTCIDIDWLDDMVDTIIPSHLDEVKVKKGKVHSFLGMTLDFSLEGKCNITMANYISDMLDEYGVTGKAKTPALPTLFEIRDSPLLPADKAKMFHRMTAMLLYLPKRCRPDIAVAVQFLSTRVLQPTEDDLVKLDRVMQYLNGTRALGICIQPDSGAINPQAYVDASYGVHADGKSHSGCVITLGKGPVFVKSGKQKINTKSSTEAELVGLSDQVSQVIWSRDFLTGQGYKLGATTVYQDNVSTMALANNGQSNSERTRHINLRYFWIKDRIQAGEITLEHLPTSEMIADILTKPLQGNLFRQMRSRLLNWEY